MKIITEWKDIGISTTNGHAIQIVTTISSFNEDEIDELKQSLGATYSVVEGTIDNDNGN